MAARLIAIVAVGLGVIVAPAATAASEPVSTDVVAPSVAEAAAAIEPRGLAVAALVSANAAGTPLPVATPTVEPPTADVATSPDSTATSGDGTQVLDAAVTGGSTNDGTEPSGEVTDPSATPAPTATDTTSPTELETTPTETEAVPTEPEAVPTAPEAPTEPEATVATPPAPAETEAPIVAPEPSQAAPGESDSSSEAPPAADGTDKPLTADPVDLDAGDADSSASPLPSWVEEVDTTDASADVPRAQPAIGGKPAKALTGSPTATRVTAAAPAVTPRSVKVTAVSAASVERPKSHNVVEQPIVELNIIVHDSGAGTSSAPALLTGGMAVAVAPRVTTTVSVAMDFARLSGGWAGPLVFNVWLRRQIRERRLSQRQLAAMSGVNHSTISRLINDGRSPSLETAAKLVHALRLEWTEEQVATYFDLLPERTLFPTQRVESALRGDLNLDDDDIRAIMDQYLIRRRRRRGADPAEGSEFPNQAGGGAARVRRRER